ncbi:MAG TPA: hypothetical protein VG538_18280 [Vicinamibacterales bacterium]|nr:hypothetical protein [Vicinamibacterales bacterium]
MSNVTAPLRTGLRAYFADAMDAFFRAAAHAPVVTRDLAVAGTAVRLHVAGDAMLPAVARALSHLETATPLDGPRLDLYAWDSTSTGVAMPRPTWPVDAYRERGEIHTVDDAGVRAALTADGPILDLWDREANRAMTWVRDHASLRWYDRSAPCRRIFNWWLSDRGCQMVHGAAVGIDGGAVLLAGRGGSGKSNAALGSLGAGLDYLGDDYCVIAPDVEPIVYSLYSTGKVDARDLPRLPFLDGLAMNAGRFDTEKAVFFFDDRFRSQVRTKAALRAVVLPAIDLHAPTRLRRASPAAALRALSMTTIGQLPHAGGEALARLAAVARQRPAFHLHVGHDAADRVPILLRRLAAGDVDADVDD